MAYKRKEQSRLFAKPTSLNLLIPQIQFRDFQKKNDAIFQKFIKQLAAKLQRRQNIRL